MHSDLKYLLIVLHIPLVILWQKNSVIDDIGTLIPANKFIISSIKALKGFDSCEMVLQTVN